MTRCIDKPEGSPSSSNLHWLLPYLEPMQRCPLCAGKTWEDLFKLDILQIYRCLQCRMMFLNPFLNPDQMKKIFSSPDLLGKACPFSAQYHDEKTWHTPRTISTYQSALRQIELYRRPQGKLLDIGCGNGIFLQLAAARGWQAFGIEPNSTNAEMLRREHGIHIYQADFSEATVPEEEFDVVALWDLIEHVPNPCEMVKQCAKLLKPRGILVIATPNHLSLLDLLAEWAYRLSFGKFIYALEKLYTVDHTLYFTQATLQHLLKQEGFTIQRPMKVNTDLSRYSMGLAFRVFSELLLAVGSALHLQNRIVVIAQKS